jgi:hypothetical protein
VSCQLVSDKPRCQVNSLSQIWFTALVGALSDMVCMMRQYHLQRCCTLCKTGTAQHAHAATSLRHTRKESVVQLR